MYVVFAYCRLLLVYFFLWRVRDAIWHVNWMIFLIVIFFKWLIRSKMFTGNNVAIITFSRVVSA